MHRIALIFILLLAAAGGASAQGFIHGNVTNASGEALAGATVVFRNSTDATATSTTDARGGYSSPRLIAGTYTVSFFAPGYESQRFTGVPMQSAAQIIVHAQMSKAGAWGSSTVSHAYVPVPMTIRARGRKAGPKLIGLFPPTKTATFTLPPGRKATSVDDLVEYDAPPAGAPASRSHSDYAPFRGNAYLSYRRDDAGEATPLEIAGSGTAIVSPAARAGSLTSGEINDFSKWALWEDISTENLKSYRSTWLFRPQSRYTVLVKSKGGTPLCNARVKMSDGRTTVWETVTDNTGKAELWYAMWTAQAPDPAQLSASVEAGGRRYNIPLLKPFDEGANILTTGASCDNPSKLDIAFIIDATGSMQDEINYLKAELRDILQRVKDSMPATQVATGAVFYRDLQDEYVTRSSDLTADFSKTEAFIGDNRADGGGDFPEALDAALQDGLDNLHWRADATARLAFLVLDAPPHGDPATVKKMQLLVAKYAARGIRLIPVVCSGSDKSNEYLMRSMALATNGTYLFLTDHSGIGGTHTAPTTDKYDVEYLNGLIYRVIHQFTYMPPCKDVIQAQPDTARIQQVTDSTTTIAWRYFPNPTTGLLHVEHTNTTGALLITDITGKAVLRIPADPSGHTTIDLGQYPAGIYAIRYNWAGDKWITGKFVLTH